MGLLVSGLSAVACSNRRPRGSPIATGNVWAAMRDTGRELRCLASVYNTIIRSKGQTMAKNMELITVSGGDAEHAVFIRACADTARAEAEVFVSVDTRTRIVTITRQRESARVFSQALRMLADIGAYPEPDAADVLQMACERAARVVRLA